MKKVFLAVLILLAAGTVVYAQQRTAGQAASTQIRQEAQQYANQARNQAAEFEEVLDNLRLWNNANNDSAIFNRIRAEIVNMEALIETEEVMLTARLENGDRISSAMFDRIERLIDQHNDKVVELEEFVAGKY